MNTINDRPPCISERFASATDSSDLTLHTEHRCDADMLLAAGYAAQGNRKGMIALMAYRMKITGDKASKWEIVEALIEHMRYEVLRRTRQSGLPKITREQSRVVVQTVINWWMDDNCVTCTGRKMQPIPGTPHLSANWCEACAGSGKRDIPDTGPHAKWLAAELDHMLTFIVGDMARRLSARLDLKSEGKP
jgi:hypothetical protein